MRGPLLVHMLNSSNIQSAFFFSCKRKGQGSSGSRPHTHCIPVVSGSGTKLDSSQAETVQDEGHALLLAGGRCSQGCRCRHGGRPCSTGGEQGSVTLRTRVLKAVAAVFLSFTCRPPSPHSREDSPPAFLSSDSFCHEKEACDLLPSFAGPWEGICRLQGRSDAHCCPVAARSRLKRAGNAERHLYVGTRAPGAGMLGGLGGLFHCQRAILSHMSLSS